MVLLLLLRRRRRYNISLVVRPFFLLSLVEKEGYLPYFSRIQTRTSKILRWESDTPFSRQLAAIPEAPHFLQFCLDHANHFSKRDVLAALTLLTTRKRLDPTSTLYHRFNQHILHRSLSLFTDSLHLLFHRYGVLGTGTALCQLGVACLPRFASLSPAQLALVAWALGRGDVADPTVWNELCRLLADKREDFMLHSLALFSWALARIDRRRPMECTIIKSRISYLLDNHSFLDKTTTLLPLQMTTTTLSSSLSSSSSSDHVDNIAQDSSIQPTGDSTRDLVMLARAFATLTPRDDPFIKKIWRAIRKGLQQSTLTSQSIASIWSTFGDLGWIDDDMLEVLCEASRGLRLDDTLSSNLITTIAHAMACLKVKDSRVVYQLVHWVEKRGVQLRSEELVVVADVLAKLNIRHVNAWKQIGLAVQRRAVELDLREIRHLYYLFEKTGMGNDRVFGYLEYFIHLREEEKVYGPA